MRPSPLTQFRTLAGEAQGVIESLVDELSERYVTVESPNTVQIDAVAVSAQPRYVIRELLIAVWRRQSWPLQSMGFAQWDELAEMIARGATRGGDSSSSKQTFPGNVSAHCHDGRLRLVRFSD